MSNIELNSDSVYFNVNSIPDPMTVPSMTVEPIINNNQIISNNQIICNDTNRREFQSMSTSNTRYYRNSENHNHQLMYRNDPNRVRRRESHILQMTNNHRPSNPMIHDQIIHDQGRRQDLHSVVNDPAINHPVIRSGYDQFGIFQTNFASSSSILPLSSTMCLPENDAESIFATDRLRSPNSIFGSNITYNYSDHPCTISVSSSTISPRASDNCNNINTELHQPQLDAQCIIAGTIYDNGYQ